ncbi:MAG: excinuclease ABC subunit UvrA [Candidatus Falkowbacteria bacterium]|nr:excinuclease ABC subunit UvrA [Candidatus Falkowbacteria bacterium]
MPNYRPKNISIRGARVNNLKNINIEIPRGKLVVITGLSGSGKSSLAFDTIYAEGQRRYVESLSSYARQFVGVMDKPDLDFIDGLSPAISIDQRSVSSNVRSTVGTVSEIYDFLRLLYAKIGVPHCPECGLRLKKAVKKEKNTPVYSCPNGHFNSQELEPSFFSFNSSQGACPDCGGLGYCPEVSGDLVLNENLSLAEGAIRPLGLNALSNPNSFFAPFAKEIKESNLDFLKPVKLFTVSEKKFLLDGGKDFLGLKKILLDRYQDTRSSFIKQEIEKCLVVSPCPACSGKRLKKESLAVKIEGLSISDFSQPALPELREKLLATESKLKSGTLPIAKPIIQEIVGRIELLEKVGLAYLSISRPSGTLSGGEAQRMRLATQIGSGLTEVIYVLDEPSIGLHQKDNDKLIETLKRLRDLGNTVIVVEHDESTMLAADHLIDVGPGAGIAGGKIIFEGTPEKIKSCRASLTGDYLSGRKKISSKKNFRPGNGKQIEIIGATEHNLKNLNVAIPLGKLVAITGVSGSGKSTLISDILANSLNRKFYRAKVEPGKHKEIKGLENIDKVISIDQSPIGRTPRSNPATYTGVFTYIRDLFAGLPEAKAKGLNAGHFSFNVIGGRCEHCEGDGVLKVEMQFMSDIYVTCDTCHGHRYQEKVLGVNYRGKSIYDFLEMTVSEAMGYFKDIAPLFEKLSVLERVGLGYLKLGQSATTLSGGEAQRVKLATELSRRSTGKTLYILDEPTTGLHFADIERLLLVINQLVDAGNTVLVIEHNLEIIKSADWVIDLGPEGGNKGGEIVGFGTPDDLKSIKASYTGKYLSLLDK